MTHLSQGGTIAAILPWSFLQADYATGLRQWLAGQFQSIRVLVLKDGHFAETTKRVLLVWLEGYGGNANGVGIAFADRPEEKPSYESIDMKAWEAEGLSQVSSGAYNILAECTERHAFVRFDKYAEVKIGVVTGADSYFIVHPEAVAEWGLSRVPRIPILTSSQGIAGLRIGKGASDRVLLIIPSPAPAAVAPYLAKGRRLDIPKRSHSVRRDPWYAITAGPTPDAFFHYRVSSVPFLALNAARCQCTNSIHRVYFRNADSKVRKWLQVSLLSVFGQLSIEASAKTYGNGVLKIEPHALKQSLVLVPESPVCAEAYNRIGADLASGRKMDAVDRATTLLCKAAGIPRELAARAYSSYHELRRRRC